MKMKRKYGNEEKKEKASRKDVKFFMLNVVIQTLGKWGSKDGDKNNKHFSKEEIGEKEKFTQIQQPLEVVTYNNPWRL